MTDSNARLERVAEAIWRADENAHEGGWWEVSPQWRDHYKRAAQAAITALHLVEESKMYEHFIPVVGSQYAGHKRSTGWRRSSRFVSPWSDEPVGGDA